MTHPSASLTVSPSRVVGAVNPRLFGSFVEHLGRCVYTGIFEPGHASADAAGLRRDVIDLVRELGVPIVRYPGGNFVSGYRWEDGIGPREQRPSRLDPAWHVTETNEFGLHEFMDFAAKAGVEPMMAINLGTRGITEALDLVEYCNVPGGSTWSDLRRANGAEEPFNVRMWCLGNEMDGPWQIGHRTSEDYGYLAARTGAALRRLDNRLELVACGSSSSAMETFGHWERTVLDRCWDDVTHVSAHAYYEERDGDVATFLASSIDMDHFIESVAGAIADVGASRGDGHHVEISFDEWNVWYTNEWTSVEGHQDIADWPVAPRQLENTYTVTDAVVVGSLLISLLRHCDVVTSACMAQLVNVIAPIMTEPGGSAWRQTTFFPFAQTSRLSRGRRVLASELNTPLVPGGSFGDVPALDAAVVLDDEGGSGAVFVVNRSVEAEMDLALPPSLVPAGSQVRTRSLWDADRMAANTAADPTRVGLGPESQVPVWATGGATLTLPPLSWTVVEFSRPA